MNDLEKELALENYVKQKVERIETEIEHLDEVFCEVLNTHEYASETWKEAQRRSNAITRIINAINLLKYEL